MKKTIGISIIILMLLLMVMPCQGFAASAPGYDTSRYIGEYYLPSEVGRAHFGVRLNIYEITDNYISFDYQRPAAGHAIHFTTEPAYFENEYTARANGTVAYADQLDNTTPLEFVLTLSYDHITVECIRDGMSIATDEFYLTRKGDFSKSNHNRRDDKFDLCFDDYYIMVQDKTLNVVDLNTYKNTVISNNASWNFISDGYDLYYYEYTKPEYTVKKLSLSTLKSQTLFSADGVFLVDCEDNTLLYYYYETDDAEAAMVSTYDIPTGRRSNIDEYYFSIKISNNRVVYDGVRGDYAPVDLYASNPDGSNKVLISDRSFVSEVYDGYIYYAEALDESYHASFEVKRCDLYGNNSVVLATVPSTRKAVIGVNPDYVEYQNWEAGDGAEERVYYNTGVAQSVERPITVKINDTAVTFDQPPIIYNDRTLVPLRAIFEALGATVTWDGETQTVTAKKGGTTIKLTIGEYEFYKNGSAIPLDVPGMIVNDRTLVPVRAVSEAFSCTVDWDGDTRTVYIFYDETSDSGTNETSDIADILTQYARNNLSVLYEDDYTGQHTYTDVRYLLADVSGDDEPELLAAGIDENGLRYLEIYRYENGDVINILKNYFGFVRGGAMNLAWYDGGVRVSYGSGSSGTGFLDRLMKYENGDWVDVYSSHMDIDYSDGGKFKGYIVNGEYVSEEEFNEARENASKNPVTLSDFGDL